MKPVYLYVVPWFPSGNMWRGGFFLDAAKALVRNGRYDVRVMSGEAGEDYEVDGIKVFRFGTCKIGCSDHLEFLTDWIKIRKFASKLRRMGLSPKDVAVCHVHLLERYAIYAAWMKRRNPSCFTIAHHHWSGMLVEGGSTWNISILRRYQQHRLRADFETVDAHVFCSEMSMRSFQGRSLGIDQDRSHVFYNGIDTNVFSPKEKRHQDDGFRIGCVANFVSSKSQITLLEAFCQVKEKMPRARVVLVGAGECLDLCKTFVKRHNLENHVEFHSEINHSDMPSFYRSLNLYVLPSFWEAFNCSLIEAWACGVPCVATEEISFKEVLPREEWDKWLFPARDVKALADKLVWAYNTRPGRQPLSHNLNIDDITSEWLDWIDATKTRVGCG